jgi:hypothetical protein
MRRREFITLLDSAAGQRMAFTQSQHVLANACLAATFVRPLL